MLYGVHVGEAEGAPKVLAKIRRDWPAGPGGATVARPRLVLPGPPPSTAELTAREYAGLRDIQAIFGDEDPEVAPVRPLDHLVAEDTLLLEYVDAPTLRRLLVQRGRLTPERFRRRRTEDRRAWQQAGAWLRTFQERMPPGVLPARQATREDVADRFAAFGDFLAYRLGARVVGDVARLGAEFAETVLPERLPLAVGHGDYAPRNVFLRGDGRLSVFDPMPRWLAPRYEDLARFLVAVRLSGNQVHTQGAAYAAGDLDRRERAVLEGYRDDDLRLADVRCYQLLVTLDRWSALVGSRPESWRRRLRVAPVELASGYLRREAERLLRLMETEQGRAVS